MAWTWTVTIIGGNYYRENGTDSGVNKYTINRHLDNTKDHEIGYKFEWNTSAGGSRYNGGWQLCMTVDGSIVETTNAYVYSKNMSTATGSWTAPKSSHTGTSSHPFTLYLSAYPVMPPSDTDITTAVGKVKVDCQTNDSHETKEYDLIPNSYSVNVSKDVAEITIQPEKYVTEYNKYSNGHTLDPIGQTQTVTLKYTNNGWKKLLPAMWYSR